MRSSSMSEISGYFNNIAIFGVAMQTPPLAKATAL
jgi:hypothetical protein